MAACSEFPAMLDLKEKIMLAAVAYGLTILLALGIIIIGLRFILAPYASSAGYGVPVDGEGARAYLTIKGLRDLHLRRAGPGPDGRGAHIMGWFMATAAIVPPGDTIIVLRYAKPRLSHSVFSSRRQL
jgi:hypothetical protein